MIQLIYAFVGSFCGGIFFNIRRRNLFWTGLAGAAGWAAYMILRGHGFHASLCIFAGAAVVGFYSEGAARLFKSPATVYSIPGIFPLVPGVTAYESIQLLVEQKLPEAAGKAIQTMAGAGAIACGILLATVIFRVISKSRQRSGESSGEGLEKD